MPLATDDRATGVIRMGSGYLLCLALATVSPSNGSSPTTGLSEAPAAGREFCVQDSQLEKGSVIRLAGVDLAKPGRRLLRGVITTGAVCAELVGSYEATASGAVFVGLKARLGNGTQELAYSMVANRSFQASGTVSTTEKRSFYQTRVTWTPTDCQAAPRCAN